MDLIVVSNGRPNRLMATLGTLLTQHVRSPKSLHLVDNSFGVLDSCRPLKKVLKAFEREGWDTHYIVTDLPTISQVKHFAYQQGADELIVAIDNDILLTRHDTVEEMLRVLEEYDVAVVSPLGFDADCERPILKNDEHYYWEVEPDEHGVAEGLTALGLCLGMRRSDLRAVFQYWRLDFPYLEDQILVHFLKKRRNYAHLHRHSVIHVSLLEEPSYVFDREEVLSYLDELGEVRPEYKEIADLRRRGEDAASFRKPLRRVEDQGN